MPKRKFLAFFGEIFEQNKMKKKKTKTNHASSSSSSHVDDFLIFEIVESSCSQRNSRRFWCGCSFSFFGRLSNNRKQTNKQTNKRKQQRVHINCTGNLISRAYWRRTDAAAAAATVVAIAGEKSRHSRRANCYSPFLLSFCCCLNSNIFLPTATVEIVQKDLWHNMKSHSH